MAATWLHVSTHVYSELTALGVETFTDCCKRAAVVVQVAQIY